jgi:hypothetical protein
MRNPDMAQQFAVSLFNNEGQGPLCDPHSVCELFFSRNLIQQGTAFALESLKSKPDELIAVTSANGLYKAQAMYLIQRKDQDLWAKVLKSDDARAKQLVVDQVVQVCAESKNADEVSETVKAFTSADMPSALIELLEKIVLQGSVFGQNRNLQNLLIVTAISADAARVMGYIGRLDKFDATDIAEFCVEKELFEEAVVIYKRNKMIVPAVNVLIENLKDLDRGLEFAKTVDDHEVWSCLAKAKAAAEVQAKAAAVAKSKAEAEAKSKAEAEALAKANAAAEAKAKADALAAEQAKYAQTLRLLKELQLEKYSKAFMCAC